MYYTATTEIHTYCHPLSLHDALPLCWPAGCRRSCPSLTSSASKRYSTKTFSNLYGRGLSMDVREGGCLCGAVRYRIRAARSEEHTSELQSLMRISYAVLCLKKKTDTYEKLLRTQLEE